MEPSRPDYPNRRAIESYAARYQLLLPDRQRASRMGELAGKRTGSSIEFQDRKDYVLGDDPRHIDWRAFARNDRLTIKLYREEISPRIDIVVDTSLSMGVTPEKIERRLDLAYLCFLMARRHHGAISLYSLGERLTRFKDPFDLLATQDRRQDSPSRCCKVLRSPGAAASRSSSAISSSPSLPPISSPPSARPIASFCSSSFHRSKITPAATA